MNKRVIAVESATNDTVRSYGEGEYIGDLQPDVEPYNKLRGFTNPCIRLDSGKYVWGLECWWGSVERMKEFIGGKTVTIVEPPNTQPMQEVKQ